MILFGSTPDSVAQQQYQRDNFLQNAAENNRTANMQAQLQNLDTLLKSQQVQRASAAHVNDQNFEANQNALNRSSALQNVLAQYRGASDNNFQKSQEDILKNLSAMAANGQVDLTMIESYRTKLTPENFQIAKGIFENSRKMMAADWAQQVQPEVQAAALGTAFADKANALAPIMAKVSNPAMAQPVNPAPKIEGMARIPFTGIPNPISYPIAAMARWAGTSTPDTSWIPDQQNRLAALQASLTTNSIPGTREPFVIKDASGAYRSNIQMPVPPPGISMPTNAVPRVWTPPAMTATNTPVAATPVTQPVAPVPVAPPKKIRVKSPNGQFGYIPSTQVEKALASGYTLAQVQ